MLWPVAGAVPNRLWATACRAYQTPDRAVLTAARAAVSHMMKVEIEVDTLAQLAEVMAVGGADVVLLDNMDTPTLRQAVEMVAGRLVTEASGNMALPRIAEVAATGVDYISAGALTHSARTLDLGLDAAKALAGG